MMSDMGVSLNIWEKSLDCGFESFASFFLNTEEMEVREPRGA
jgi:hypothetical protein